MLKKILILGSNSYSGNYLVAFLLKKRFSVIGCSLSNQSEERFNAISQLPKKLQNKYKFKKIDINKDFNNLKKLILKNKPNVIIDFLGQGMVAESWEHPHLTFNTNVLSKIKLYNSICPFLHENKSSISYSSIILSAFTLNVSNKFFICSSHSEYFLSPLSIIKPIHTPWGSNV